MVLSESTHLRKKAEDDLITAKILYDADEELTWIICYHLQQYVEKMLKAKLDEKKIPFKKTHDIRTLIEMFPEKDNFKDVLQDADRMTNYCVETRYQNYSPSIDEMKRAFVIAERIVSISESISDL